MTPRMQYLGTSADGRQRWRGTGFSTAPDGVTLVSVYWSALWHVLKFPWVLADLSKRPGPFIVRGSE